jgi:hypothetical protein
MKIKPLHQQIIDKAVFYRTAPDMETIDHPPKECE